MTRKEQPELAEPYLPNEQVRRRRYGGALLVLTLASGFGALTMVGYAMQEDSLRKAIAVAGGGLLVGGASLLVGGLIGFLFGVPRLPPGEDRRSTEEETPIESTRGRAPYRPNTNLEEISDWLTKILVGVGLTQLSAIPAGLRDIGQVLAPVLGGLPGSEVFALGALVHFSVCGFLMSFLWTRLTLLQLYTDAELGAAEERGVRIGADRFLESAQRASAVKSPKERFALWVDDRLEKNVRERELMERLLGLRFQNVRSTPEALAEIEREGKKYSLIISDMSRPGDPQAGYTLLEQLKTKGIQKPFIIYTASGRPEHDAEARRQGAEGSTNNPQRLLDLVRNALERVE
jgi:CheY-like chemotaxis protein